MIITPLSEFAQSYAITSLMTALLIGFVLIVRRPVARYAGAGTSYLLWALPALRLALPPLPASLMPANLMPGNILEKWGAMISDLLAAIRHPQPATSGADTQQAEPVTRIIEPLGEFVPHAAVVNEQSPFEWSLVLLILWACGALLVLAWFFKQQLQFQKLIQQTAIEPDEALRQRAATLAAQYRIKESYRLKVSAVRSEMLVAGLVRPLIVVPESFETLFSVEEQNVALSHELTHIKRGDLWALHLAHIFVALQWFNPLAWIALDKFRHDQEAACDASLLNDRIMTPHRYGQTLVKAAALISDPMKTDGRAKHPLGSRSAALTLSHSIKERLTLMQNPLPSFKRRLLGAATVLVLSGCAMASTAVTAADDEKNSDEETYSSYSFNNGNSKIVIGDKMLQVDDKVSNDRSMVFINDPFQWIEVKMEPLEEIEAIEGIDYDMEMEELPEPPSPPEIMIMADKEDVKEIEVEGGRKIIIRDTEIFIPDDIKDMAQFEEEMAQYEKKMEGKMKIIEEKHADMIEVHGDMVEKRLSMVFDEEFERKQDQSDSIVRALVTQCIDHQFTNAQPALMAAEDPETGETYKSLCIQGDQKAFSSQEVTSFVKNSPALTSEEKDHFFARNKARKTYNYVFRSEEE